MESIEFSYTRRERTRCVLQPGVHGFSMASFLVPMLFVYFGIDVIFTSDTIEGFGFVYWLYDASFLAILAFLVKDGYTATGKCLGARTLSFGNDQMSISTEGQSISMTALKGFALISPSYFLLHRTDDTVTLIPKRIFESPGQVEHFKSCGENLVASHKRQFVASQNDAGSTAR